MFYLFVQPVTLVDKEDEHMNHWNPGTSRKVAEAEILGERLSDLGRSPEISSFR